MRECRAKELRLRLFSREPDRPHRSVTVTDLKNGRDEMARRLGMLLALLVGGVLAPVLAAAQHSGHRASPYAGFEQRAVKGLSADEIADLRSGRGMGLALVAELNGYPGPVP